MKAVNKEAIIILEKVLKPLEACEPQCKLNLNPEKIRKAVTLLKEQPPASDFTKECRELRKRGATDEQLEYAEKMMEACDTIDQQAAQLKAKDELLFAFESVRAPKQPPAGEFTKENRRYFTLLPEDECDTITQKAVRHCSLVIQEACDRLDSSEASRKELLEVCEKALFAINQRTTAHIATEIRNAKYGLNTNFPTITKGEIAAEKLIIAAIKANEQGD